MATYVYRCRSHGDFDVRRPLGQASSAEACPRCAASARRVFTAPRLSAQPSAVTEAYDAAAASSERPAVVSAPPRRRTPSAGTPNPATSRLPRP
ncbi:zinc ribbon domain-containing protein [Nocardioides sp. KR10-350]|uniref:zinc ribbon domain-containing protein n=1 Tax=Nocardioides cheoyonin TaxID=3156615 RepID=UPI0032B5A5F1